MSLDAAKGGPQRRLVRRALHVAVSLAVLYYWFPPAVREFGVSRDTLMLAAFGAFVLIEGVRLWRGALFFPMREYERQQVGGHLWLVFGCVVALMFFEQRFAMLTILGTTLVDPLIGEVREAGRPRAAVLVGFAAWCAVAAAAVALTPLATPLPLIPVGAAAAVAAEHFKVRHVDDNFLMNLVPLVGMTLLAWALPSH